MPAAVKDPPAADTPVPLLTAAGDPNPPATNPLILNNAYFELTGVNLRCTVKHLEAPFPENKLVTVTSLCGEIDYPGVTKYHLRVTFYQDFTAGSVFATLNAAYQAYLASGTPAAWKARPNASVAASATNPTICSVITSILAGDVYQPSMWHSMVRNKGFSNTADARVLHGVRSSRQAKPAEPPPQ